MECPPENSIKSPPSFQCFYFEGFVVVSERLDEVVELLLRQSDEVEQHDELCLLLAVRGDREDDVAVVPARDTPNDTCFMKATIRLYPTARAVGRQLVRRGRVY